MTMRSSADNGRGGRVVAAGNSELVVKGSRFQATCHPVASPAEAEHALENFRQEHRRATHVCFAWRIGEHGESLRQNDAGEPSGTAGRPILAAIEEAHATDALVMVARVFGGVKLGAAGLKRAYHRVAADAVGAATILSPDHEIVGLAVEVAYPLVSQVEYLVKKHHGRIADSTYGVTVSIVIDVTAEHAPELSRQLDQLTRLASEERRR